MTAAVPPREPAATVRPGRRPWPVPGRKEWIVALAATLLACGAWLAGPLRALERPAGDLLLRAPRPGGAVDPGVVAVLVDEDALESLGPWPWPRHRLAALVERIRDLGARRVVVDLLLDAPGGKNGDALLGRALARGPSVLAVALDRRGRWILPPPPLRKAARMAHAHAEVASDGVVRSVTVSKQGGGLALPALAVAAAGAEGAFRPGQLLWPGFGTPPRDIPQVSARDLLGSGSGDLPELGGKVVLVGASAAGIGDRWVVPTGSRTPVPGVLVHASITASVLAGDILRRPGLPAAALAGLLLALGLQAARSRAGALRAVHLAGGAAALMLAALALLWWGHVLLPVATVASAGILSVIAREAGESLRVRREVGRMLDAVLMEAEAPGDLLPEDGGDRLTRLRKLQERLRRDRDLRRALLEGLAEGVVLWSPEGGPVLANTAAVHLWGGVPRRGDPGLEDLEEGAGIRMERHGRSLHLEVRSLPVGDLLTLRDVTAQEELERRRREVHRLVSHELKTPLASISGFAEMIERYELSGEELDRVASLIRRESGRLIGMVTAYLDLERLEAGTWEDERRPLDLVPLVRRRLEVLRAAARDSRIELENAGPAPVEGVPTLLERVVDNLVGNALKHSPDGAPVTVSLRATGGLVVLSVRDRGPGIPPEARQRLFERFFRVPGDPAPGSGLGLALVREVVRWHGGRVEAANAPGGGAVLTVHLPRAKGGGA